MEDKSKNNRVLAILGSGALMFIVTVIFFLWTEFSPPRAPKEIVDLLESQKTIQIAIATAIVQDNNGKEVQELISEMNAVNTRVAELTSELSDEEQVAVEEARNKILEGAPDIAANLGESLNPSPSTTLQPNITTTPPMMSSLKETVILSENSDNNYNWSDGGIYVTTLQVYEGERAFISNGNNSFEKDMGIVGYEPDEFRYFAFKAYLLEKEAGLLLQTRFDDSWDHRWAFDGRSSYEGGYSWARQGQTVDLPVGEWVDINLDIINDLGARPGQKLTGLAFSGNDGKFLYDYVTLAPSELLTACSTVPFQDGANNQEDVFLSSSDDYNDFDWKSGNLYNTTQLALQDDVGFIANGNATTEREFGIIGHEPSEIRYISFWVCLLEEDAGLLLQTKVDGSWEHRWGIDGRNSYQGEFNWPMLGVDVNIPVNEWVHVTVDFINDLEARPGQTLQGLAFSGADGNMVFDRVAFASSEKR